MFEDSRSIKPDLIIRNAAEVITCTGDSMEEIGLLTNAAIAIKDGRIVGVCSNEEIELRFNSDEAVSIDASGKVVAPGFVDSHTHLVFYGTRVEEYAAKLTGKNNPEQLKKLGIATGPNRTVELTRNRPEEELLEQSKKRLLTMLEHGITTVESKSGYGLTTESEIKILEVSRRLNEETPLDVFNTFLGAHGFPENVTKAEYLDVIINEMIPQVGERGLAEFCDVWCDEGYFTAEESELILKAGLQYGMKPKIHADAYSYIGGTDLAAEMKMVSVDHLNYTPVEVMEKLAEAKVTGVLMPSLDFAVSHKRPFEARKMLDLGMNIALATDLCPASYTQSMQFVIALACKLYQFSVEEAIKAATYGGARALDLDDRGVIQEGKLADLQIWDVPTYKHIAYELGTNIVETVIKNGKVVVNR
ncbi:imidazolonepropionase [Neobacillus vireti]|uniref:Imidazolonepropionase n=1 Tax=Neobacillus vireti LMG 21834 TaxID=1131730 RepID=A0AB94IR59_9BACI|nr:imidazolonepropionase [Neobacillus vireti]ETI69493.1 imidazolonepropionase [Neobacillus vireti LMG 21834]KLT17777.1 imidazolonepropionase [Neobacillus vireti]